MGVSFRSVVLVLAGLLAGEGAVVPGARASGDASGLVLASAPVSGAPYAAAATADGYRVFVSVAGRGGTERASVAELFRTPAGFGHVRFQVPLRSTRALGLALLADESTLLVADGDGLELVNVRTIAGRRRGSLQFVAAHDGARTSDVAVSPDDRFAYVTEAGRDAVAVFALRHGSNGAVGARLLREIPVARVPGDAVLASRGDTLYVASRGDDRASRSGSPCSRGTIAAIDTRRAQTGSQHAVVARIPTGCGPAQLALTSDGATLWLALRGDNAVVAYDTHRLVSDPMHAEIKRIAAPPAPTAIALAAGDGALVVANADRFDPSVTGPSATFFDVRGEPAVINGFRTGADPVRFSRSPDGKTLYLTNAGSRTVQVIDATRAVQPGE